MLPGCLGLIPAVLVLVRSGETLELRAVDRGEKIGPISIPRSGTSFSEYVLTHG